MQFRQTTKATQSCACTSGPGGRMMNGIDLFYCLCLVKALAHQKYSTSYEGLIYHCFGQFFQRQVWNTFFKINHSILYSTCADKIRVLNSYQNPYNSCFKMADTAICG